MYINLVGVTSDLPVAPCQATMSRDSHQSDCELFTNLRKKNDGEIYSEDLNRSFSKMASEYRRGTAMALRKGWLDKPSREEDLRPLARMYEYCCWSAIHNYLAELHEQSLTEILLLFQSRRDFLLRADEDYPDTDDHQLMVTAINSVAAALGTKAITAEDFDSKVQFDLSKNHTRLFYAETPTGSSSCSSS